MNAQVGINTTAPKASLEIKTSNQAAPSNTDGILLPRVDNFPSIKPTIDQNGIMVYLTSAVGIKPPGIYIWDYSKTDWLCLSKEVVSPTLAHYVGELFGGGIVCHVYDNGNHGIIASLADLDGGIGAAWGVSGIDVVDANSYYDGVANTAAIIAAGGTSTEAAGLCNDYAAGGFTDWYLPSMHEMKLIVENDILIDSILDNDGDSLTHGFTQEYSSVTKGGYWASMQISPTLGNFFNFLIYPFILNPKTKLFSVRAIRAF